MTNFDIEKLDRKTPYKTPDHFFDAVQDRVLQQTIEKKKQVKMSPIYTKWAVAASVTLFAGLSAFFISSQDEEISITKNNVIIDSTYNSETALANNDVTEVPRIDTENQSDSDPKEALIVTKKSNVKENNLKNYSPKTKSSFAKSSSSADSKVNKALAIFTPDQISEMDKSIEQDIYLDLYN